MNKFRSSLLRGFTLIELMVVIAVMAVLLGLTVPAFQGIGRGSRAKTAVFQLNTTLNLARQMAITTRQRVHVVFPDNGLTYTTTNKHLAYSGYAVYAEKEGEYVGDWRLLPSGIVFYDMNTVLPANLKGANLLMEAPIYEKSVPFDRKGQAPQNLMALSFRADGAVDHAGTNRKGIYLTEGWVDAEPSIAVSFRPEATVYGLEIKPESGQSRVREYYPPK